MILLGILRFEVMVFFVIIKNLYYFELVYFFFLKDERFC